LRQPLEKNKGLGLGAAFDVGTTTLVAALVDLETREVIATASLPNPQSGWGRDVVARMEAAVGPGGALDELKAAITEALSGLLASVTGDRQGEVSAAAAAGNSVMEHLLLGVSPEPLSKVPYRPAFREALTAVDAVAGLGCGLYVFPLIGGFVGGDAVAVALSLGMPGEGRPALAIDIGTNSEILLSSGGVLYATSAAAGPAFEGGEVKDGMIAAPGAIEGVAVEDDTVRLAVIGGIAPRGICGSGLIEAVSALLKTGVIDRTGRIKDPDEVESNLSSRIKTGPQGNSFTLYRGPKTEIALTQQDVRALQTAKSATRAGISMLLKKAGISPGEVGTVFIAGAFGSHLREEGLRTIGLLDEAWTGIRTVGDAALDGAVMALYEDGRKQAEKIAREARYVSLSGSSHFEREFIRNMNF